MSDELSRFPEINQLRAKLQSLAPSDPSLVSMADKPMMRRAFFPGGNGLVLGEDARVFPVGGMMILGSNFGAEEKFCTSAGELLCQDETRNPGTWMGLRRRFTQQQLEKCFFTNAWPFLHRSKSNNPTDAEKKRWLRPPVLTSCSDFFRFSLDIVKPSVIVTLGTAPAAFLGYCFPKVLSTWQGNSWSSIDSKPFAEVCIGTRQTLCVAWTHPSMSNVHSRREDLRDEGKLLLSAMASTAL